MTLRVAALVACAAVGAAAVFEILTGHTDGWTQGAIGAGIGLTLLALETRRYAGVTTPGAGSWVATGEKFVDPASGEPTEVWTNANGERQYRPMKPRAN